MKTTILAVFVCVLLILRDKNLLLENLALRQQLSIMKQHVKRPRIRIRDRIFWVFLSKIWKDWKNVLIVVKPETVIRWHRKGFKLFWTFKSRKRCVGRPSLYPEIRKLIQDMARANPLWVGLSMLLNHRAYYTTLRIPLKDGRCFYLCFDPMD